MNKKSLYSLKEWLTIPEAAKYLSLVFGESVTEADVLRLGLDGHLMLSVYFVNHASAKMGELVPMDKAKLHVIPSSLNDFFKERYFDEIESGEVDSLPDWVQDRLKNGSFMLMPCGDVVDDNNVIQYKNEIVSIKDVWDLPMIGGEQLDVEHEYQQLTGGPAVTLTCLGGAFVISPEGKYANIQQSYDENEYQKGSTANLQELKRYISENKVAPEQAKSMLDQHKKDRAKYLEERSNKPRSEDYHSAGGLPDDSVLVVRTSALRELEKTLVCDVDCLNKEVSATERNSLLTIIAALCDELNIDVNARGASKQIANLTENLGAPVSDDTIRRIIKKIDLALESRMK